MFDQILMGSLNYTKINGSKLLGIGLDWPHVNKIELIVEVLVDDSFHGAELRLEGVSVVESSHDLPLDLQQLIVVG
jgi:hypothetical protein